MSVEADGYTYNADRTRRITVHGGPDSLGRWSYSEEWTANYHPGDPRGEHRAAWRGQVFYRTLPAWFQHDQKKPAPDGGRR